MKIEYILLGMTALLVLVLFVLLILAGVRNSRPKKKRIVSNDMAKIKEQINDDIK